MPADTSQTPSGAARLLTEKIAVVNVGLDGFVADLRANAVEVVHVDWAPPAGGDPEMAALLARLGG
ncbi:hypothetical protein E2L08_06170 [Palleronia sediminis]|uniref:FdrA domain protein n=1 Tax=Palleronia sediminis TaxID=2547833 RepID=A0A4R6AHY2_9RHOB|nr:hypothetical protein [Palleronia sediminis]TDL81256.1 hypothetical protein E2L08_06170 [Palleronia sediminis]